MTTRHSVHYRNSANMEQVPDGSIDLVVTSPPYPMIEMWDEPFTELNPAIADAIREQDGSSAFSMMHSELDQVWSECRRVLKPGAYLCINIGDATRKIGKNFRLYSNHSRIISQCEAIGFQSLPLVLWRKPTNAPNKYMGSGMLPSGAYVTLEHEYVIILRKGDKREFTQTEKERRRKSAFFWEERNTWFSDLWELKGTRQLLPDVSARKRSAAFPLELAHRLICMYSVQGDTVLDPFLGTATTTAASIANARNSIGFELLDSFEPIIEATLEAVAGNANKLVRERIDNHLQFVQDYESRKQKSLNHVNKRYGFRVMTTQETDIELQKVERITRLDEQTIESNHSAAEMDSDEAGASFSGFAQQHPGDDQFTLSFRE